MSLETTIIDYLHYHPGVSRLDLMAHAGIPVGDAQTKRTLARLIARGDLHAEGKARATRYYVTTKARLLRTVDLDRYYAKPLGVQETVS